ncbi:gp119 [Sphingomonas phage PAU]|uniref:gp119 n=1 Tax=Sphingomonas phage PAU TaxID=1150991 RepID=UPI000257326A|nr:gp119 [Sphingomonas phage PAU]AFF28117.1 gp119 [Sphingomonas phage PAU]
MENKGFLKLKKRIPFKPQTVDKYGDFDLKETEQSIKQVSLLGLNSDTSVVYFSDEIDRNLSNTNIGMYNHVRNTLIVNNSNTVYFISSKMENSYEFFRNTDLTEDILMNVSYAIGTIKDSKIFITHVKERIKRNQNLKIVAGGCYYLSNKESTNILLYKTGHHWDQERLVDPVTKYEWRKDGRNTIPGNQLYDLADYHEKFNENYEWIMIMCAAAYYIHGWCFRNIFTEYDWVTKNRKHIYYGEHGQYEPREKETVKYHEILSWSTKSKQDIVSELRLRCQEIFVKKHAKWKAKPYTEAGGECGIYSIQEPTNPAKSWKILEIGLKYDVNYVKPEKVKTEHDVSNIEMFKV